MEEMEKAKTLGRDSIFQKFEEARRVGQGSIQEYIVRAVALETFL